MISIQHCIFCFEIREPTAQALTPRRENCPTCCNVLRFGAGLAARLLFQSCGKPEFIRPQNCSDRQYPDTMIKDVRRLLDNTQEAMHHITLYNGMHECIKPTSNVILGLTAHDLATDHVIKHVIKLGCTSTYPAQVSNFHPTSTSRPRWVE